MADAVFSIETPEVLPIRGGLFAVANVVDVADPHFGMGPVEYFEANVEIPKLAPGLCWGDPESDPDAVKTFDGITTTRGSFPFPLYSGIECGLAYSEDYLTRAESQLDRGEEIAVGRAFQTWVLDQPGVVELNATADRGVRNGVASLEQYMGANYSALPTFHGNRYIANLANLETSDDFTMSTKQGTPFANSGGYADIDGDETILFATGRVTIFRSPVSSHQIDVPTQNRHMALAERIYSFTVDGPIAVVHVTIPEG